MGDRGVGVRVRSGDNGWSGGGGEGKGSRVG